jgi:ribosomal protein L37AE/L43A
MVLFTRRFSMDLRKCEHCGNMFWGDAETRFCALCAVVEKTRERTTEPPRESSDRQLQPAAA